MIQTDFEEFATIVGKCQIVTEPLSKSQKNLRGRRPVDMTHDQLVDWIDTCEKMERWVKAAKVRHGWKESGQEARLELELRNVQA